MPKVWCAETTCKHNKDNLCSAKKINLSAGQIHTVHEGCRQLWTCRTYEMSYEAKKLKEVIESFYTRGYGDGMDKR